jgi:hypothetical protein
LLLLFQQHRFVAISLGFCFVVDSFFLDKVHWWQRRVSLGRGGVEMMLCVVCQCSVVLFEGFWLFLLYSVFLWGSYCWGFAQSLFFHGSEHRNKID